MSRSARGRIGAVAARVLVPTLLIAGAASAKGVPWISAQLQVFDRPDVLRYALGLGALASGALLLQDRTRRLGAVLAGLLAAYLVWAAWIADSLRSPFGIASSSVLFLAILLGSSPVPIGAARAFTDPLAPSPPGVGTWRRVLLALEVCGLGFFALWLVGGVVYQVGAPLLGALVWMREGRPRTGVVEKMLLYMLVFVYGVGGLYGFVGHFFLADQVARSIGWAVGSGFQTELAFYHLGFGIVALLGIWIRDHLWTASVLGKSVFVYGANFTHIRDIVREGNYAPGNAGFPVLFGNFFTPTIMLLLLVLYLRSQTAGHVRPIPRPGLPVATPQPTALESP